MSTAGTLYLIDGSLYIFRSWHAVPPTFHDHEGAPVNAVYGFTRFLCDFLERVKPTHAVVAFDESLTSSFRNTIYPEYKANRELPPDELRKQFWYCKQVATALGLCVLSHAHYEADDLIGSALWGLRSHGFRGVIVSGVVESDATSLALEITHRPASAPVCSAVPVSSGSTPWAR